ncbi:hypothetical protein [Wenyingzhuangia sp. 2_MG-2023]|uniref:hypothetical protein n=1 Tax=Wenyingzhuangia sp. 2_MG-2023 TaxID=3062639 RepID=UPI0026E44BA6|nr:hypothetical protein [Wenyingzhuangia sp. 2_MG-2023]MDO6737071.1 hypothetical protein [Wenyingzhuangia sp. 2_MG-2023]
MKKITQEEAQKRGLKAVIYCQLACEAIAGLIGTDLYVREAKNYANKFCKSIDSLANQYDLVYDEGGEGAQTILNDIDGLIKKLSSGDIEVVQAVARIHEGYLAKLESLKKESNE